MGIGEMGTQGQLVPRLPKLLLDSWKFLLLELTFGM